MTKRRVRAVVLWFVVVLVPMSPALADGALDARGELDEIVAQHRATCGLETGLADRRSGGESLPGTTWVVQEIEGRGVLDTPRATLTFEGDGKVSGDGGCNRFFGAVEIDGSAIAFGPLGATRRACGEAIDAQEIAFLGALAKAAAVSLEADVLVMVAADETPLLRLARAE